MTGSNDVININKGTWRTKEAKGGVVVSKSLSKDLTQRQSQSRMGREDTVHLKNVQSKFSHTQGIHISTF